jgi:hypothetical protein
MSGSRVSPADPVFQKPQQPGELGFELTQSLVMRKDVQTRTTVQYPGGLKEPVHYQWCSGEGGAGLIPDHSPCHGAAQL